LSEEAEEEGADLAEHGEIAYAFREHGGRAVVRVPEDEDELARAGAYRVYQDPADMLAHLDEVGVRSPGA
jgi:hypothetical protein